MLTQRGERAASILLKGFSACYGIGDRLGNLLAGFVAKAAEYPAAFLTLAAIGLGALVLCWFFVPETNKEAGGNRAVTPG